MYEKKLEYAASLFFFFAAFIASSIVGVMFSLLEWFLVFGFPISLISSLWAFVLAKSLIISPQTSLAAYSEIGAKYGISVVFCTIFSLSIIFAVFGFFIDLNQNQILFFFIHIIAGFIFFSIFTIGAPYILGGVLGAIFFVLWGKRSSKLRNKATNTPLEGKEGDRFL